MIARRVSLGFHYLLAHYRDGTVLRFPTWFAIAMQQPGPASSQWGQGSQVSGSHPPSGQPGKGCSVAQARTEGKGELKCRS